MGGVGDLTTAYDRAWVVVSPLRMGTGLKIKSIEALGMGKALVSAPAGYTGLEDGLGKAYLPGDLASEFIDNCVKLLCDSAARRSLESSAYEFASRWNERQREELLGILRVRGIA
jgi:glycosyltransferase involved in cell wall biosynthesis